MFYGFPRTAPRNIMENERKRYDPWQGGKYGGFLEFETENIAYRITRYFGKTAAKDEFSLWDITNRQKSTRFSEKLGEELFQLDVNSFTRSTYISQLSVEDMEATTSIRTKLSNLVEDTNDLCNYDTAEKKLRDYRAKYRAYRGNGGSINDLDKEYNDLESKKFLAEQQNVTLQETIDKIEELNAERILKTDSIKELRDKIRMASDQKARQMRQEQFRARREEVDKKQRALEEMDVNYPAGYPTEEEIRKQHENISIIQHEKMRLENLNLDAADRETVENEKRWLSDIDQTANDIEQCDQNCKELNKVSAKLSSQMLPEELKKLDMLTKNFEMGVPTDDEIQDCLSVADIFADTQRQISETIVLPESQKRLDQLKEYFRGEIPDETVLHAWEQERQERDSLIQSRKAHEFLETDLRKYQILQRTFASGIPTEEEIQNKQKDARRIAELTTKKNTKTTITQEEPANLSKSSSKVSIVCGCIGIVLLALGMVCFVTNMLMPGIILLVIGFLTMLAAFWMRIKYMVNSQKHSTSILTTSAITDEENQELYDLQHDLNDFLLRFYANVEEPEKKLVQLLVDMKSFTELTEKKNVSENELYHINEKINTKKQYLIKVFEQYYPDGTYYDGFIQELRSNSSKYVSLTEEVNNVMVKRKNLYKKADECRLQIDTFLKKYYSKELSDDLRQEVRDLADNVKTYNELKAKKKAMLEENAESQVRADELMSQIQEILLTYNAFDQTVSVDICLNMLRKRFEGFKRANERLTRYTQDYETISSQISQAETDVEYFLKKYQLPDDTPANIINYVDEDIHSRMNTEKGLKEAEDKLCDFLRKYPEAEREVPEGNEERSDPEKLQRSEKEMQQRMDEIDSELREYRQEREKIRYTVENIPEYEDRMKQIKIEKEENERKCSIAEKTLDLLNQAKDNLANSYVGKVEKGFVYYANTLMGGQLGHVTIDKDLKLYIDEKGEAREVGSFSSGIIDCIMICMRLSLIDALFTNEEPFLIFDDPFVNMDDNHTKRALEMLHKIAENHQVVYMVCNSSRQ